jgi:hypothetical protein
MPLPAARRPTATDGFVFAVKQFTNGRSQAARTKPLVMRSKLCGICRSETASQWGIALLFFS